MLLASRGALGLHRIPLRELVGGEHRSDLLIESGAELLHLLMLRLQRRLERVGLGRVTRLLRRAQVAQVLMERLEECLVFGAEVLMQIADLLPLRVAEVQLLRELLGVFAAMAGLRGVESVDAIRILTASKAMLLMLAGILLVFFAPNTWELHYPRSRRWSFVLAALMLLCILDFATPSPFLYFQF